MCFHLFIVDNANWTTVIEKGLQLAELLQLGGNNTSFDWLKTIAGMPIEEITNITTALFSGNIRMLRNM